MSKSKRNKTKSACGCQSGILRFVRLPYRNFFHAACFDHDNLYDFGGDEHDRKAADYTLFQYMFYLAYRSNRSPLSKVWLAQIALLYYIGVRIFGRFYFNWKSND